MERIKQALEKARGERESSQAGSHIANGETRRSVVETEIRYSETQVMHLDEDILRENRVLSGGADPEAVTAYKMLRTQVLQRMVAREWNALGVSSPSAGDGKTVTAVNLALSLAREYHHTVLLVDMDLCNPCVSKYFGLQPSKGIDDYFLRGASLSEVMINPGIERLVLLPAREPVDSSSELLASPLTGELVRELKSRYPSRLVLFDLPPILASDDALSFAPHIDTLLLVLRDAKTTQKEAEHAIELLADIPILGTVLNAATEKISTYY